MTQYVAVEASSRRILGAVGRRDPENFNGVIDLRPFPRNGTVYYLWQARLESSPRPSCVQLWTEGAPEWVETAPLSEIQAQALQEIDAAAEALRLAVVNHMPMQTEEYRQALQQAQAWRTAGYPETDEQPAPPDVTCWAMAKWRAGWSARQACDDILSTAALWEAVLSKVRMLRLANKEDVRYAGDVAAINGIVADMRADMQKIAQQMGLPVKYDNSITFKEV